jgi:hypothetical protein
MMANFRGYLRSTQKYPDVVRRFFHTKPVRYALPDTFIYLAH